MCRIVQAVSIGSMVPDQFYGKVHSVFNTAANLSVEGLDHLLTLILSDTMDLPQGIRLVPEEADVIQRLEHGQVVTCQESVVRSTGFPFEIDLRHAHPYDGRILCPLKLSVQKMARPYRVALEMLAKQQGEKLSELNITHLSPSIAGIEEAIREEPPVVRQLSSLIDSARRLDHPQAAVAVRALVGLGGGLTPTGDDVLVGFLAGLQAAVGVEAARSKWLGELSETLRIASNETNDISRTYLILAADGQFSSSLKNLAGAVCVGEPEEKVREVAEIAFQVGHTSGMDAATGLLAGLAAWQDGLIPKSLSGDMVAHFAA